MGKIYKLFQYIITYMALLCIFLTVTNSLFSTSDFLTSVAAILDAIIVAVGVFIFVHPH